jgi:hypothetical protein
MTRERRLLMMDMAFIIAEHIVDATATDQPARDRT